MERKTLTVTVYNKEWKIISREEVPAKREPLWYHKRGLLQTATGYGKRLVTEYMVFFLGRWRRVYCSQFSNAGTCYLDIKGMPRVFVDD